MFKTSQTKINHFQEATSFPRTLQNQPSANRKPCRKSIKLETKLPIEQPCDKTQIAIVSPFLPEKLTPNFEFPHFLCTSVIETLSQQKMPGNVAQSANQAECLSGCKFVRLHEPATPGTPPRVNQFVFNPRAIGKSLIEQIVLFLDRRTSRYGQ